jgi:uncharacterized delta-60 repeat protein
MIKWALITGLIGLATALQAAQVEQLWEARYDGPAFREDLLFAMTVDAGGRVYVTGSSDNNVNPDPYATIKYDTNGIPQWVARYTGPRMIDSPSAIALDIQGNVYVTGFSHGTNSGYDPDFATVKYSPEGTELWVARYNAHTNPVSTADIPHAMLVNGAGQVYVTGGSVSPQGSMDFLTIKYDTSGTQLWVRRYNSPALRVDSANSIGIDGFGNIYVGGISERYDGGHDVAVVKYAPDGTQLWASHFPAAKYGQLPSMAMKVDGAGNSYLAFAGRDETWRFSVIKFDHDGTLLWDRPRRLLRDQSEIFVAGVQLDDSDNLCVLTSMNQLGNADYVTLKFSRDGEELWSSRFNSEWDNQEHARSIAIDGADNIYVTGVAYRAGNEYYFATVKYRPNGHREWVAISGDVPSTGVSSGVVQVDNAGHVYVSGSIGPLGTRDYYTVKYRQTPQAGAPSITSAPTNQNALAGGSVTFSVTATGNEPLSYVWRRDGRIIEGANGCLFELQNVTFADRGYYTVEVFNNEGSAASPEAALNVIIRPSIVEHPEPRTVVLGASADFSVVAGGTPPFTYQWRHDGMPIAAATNATLVISNVQSGDVGEYSVTVSNEAGSTNSRTARLTLMPGLEQCFATAAREGVDNYSFPQVLRVDSQGRANVLQTAYAGGEPDMVTMQFETNGALRWLARFGGGTNAVNYATALAVDGAGNVYAAGTSGSPTNQRMAVVKYSPNGDQIWAAFHYAPSNRYEYPSAIAVDSTGSVYLTGNGAAANQPQHMRTVKFDASGNQAWSVRFSTSDVSSDTASDLKVDATGAVYIFGSSVDASVRLTTIKYDGDGNVVWVRTHESRSSGSATALRLDSFGNIVVTGTAAEADGITDTTTLKYDPDGNVLWLARYSAYQDSWDYPTAMALDSANNVYIATGSSLPGEENTGISVYSTVKYDADGNELWVASRRDNAGAGGPDSLAVDSSGNSYLAFSKYFESSGSDFVILKYNSAGSRVWTTTWGRPGPSEEYASGVALDPVGDLLVSGLGATPPSTVLLLKYKDRPAPGLPMITEGPQSRDAAAGSTVVFSVTATGDAPLAYQWYFNGEEIGGATSSSYAIANVVANHAGHYSVEVRNAVGAVVSRTAILTIGIGPSIVRQPTGQSVLLGTDVLFEVAATGSRPLHYQWRFNGSNIAGANSALLRLSNVQNSDTGVYSVIVSNRAGTVASAGAILSVNQNARREWLVALSAGMMLHATPTDMEVDVAGNVYVTGYADYGPRFLTAKYDSTGQQLWATNYDSVGGGRPLALDVDAAGNSYVVGYVFTPAGVGAMVTVKYSSDGQELWVRSFSPPESALATDVNVGADGSVYVTGEAGGPTRGITTIKYNSNGTQVWMTHYGGTQNPATGHRVLTDAVGNVYVAGQVYINGNRLPVLIKYHFTGGIAWSHIYTEAGSAEVADLALDSAANAILSVYASTWNGRIVTVKFNYAGDVQWAARFGSGYGREEPTAIALDDADNIYVTGLIYVGATYDDDGNYYPNEDIVTLKYNSNGVLQWSGRYGGSRIDTGADIAVDSAGGVYVTGSLTGENGSEDMVVLRYDTNGTRYWVDVLAGESGGTDRGLVVRTAGSNCVYAAGLTVVGGYENIALLKYTHTAASGAPAITSAPQSQDAIAGTTVSFSVSATGDSPLVYRWYFNGSVIPDAFGPTLVIPNVETTNAGLYTVEVSNPVGQVVSADAFLTVHVPARIRSGPEDQCIVAGSRAVFQITYDGEAPIGIYWQRNGEPFGDGSPFLFVDNASAADAGIYSVTVSNEFGSMTASARLTITPRVSLAWADRFHSGGMTNDQAEAGTADAAGNVYITGTVPAGIQTVKFNTDGALAWATVYGPTNGGSAFAKAIALGSNGDVYVAGAMYDSGDQDFITLKYDANGALLWAARYDHGGTDVPTAMAVDAAGNVYVTGSGGAISYQADYVTVKYDANGTELWARAYEGEDGGDDRPAAIAVDGAGNVYLTGYTTEANTIEYYPLGDYLTLKYASDGTELWVARHSGPGGADDRAVAIAVDGDGNAYVTGSHSHDYYVNSGTTVYFDYDYATLKYDANGQRVWLAVYSSGRPRAPDEAVALKLDAAGNIYVTGSSEGDMVTVRYNNAGQQQWVARVDSGWDYERPEALTLDNSGNIYVTGLSGYYDDIITFKLDPNGSREWLARYDGGASGYGDYPVGIAVDAGSNVFVAGATTGSGTGSDYVSLKYAIGNGAGAPAITTPPRDQSATVGSTVILRVDASGAASLRYQWRRNGVPIAGETNATLQIHGVTFAHAGRYSVVVYNDLDCTISADAVLTVVAAQFVECTRIERRNDGAIRLIIAGPPSYYYRIEATADFLSWETLDTIYNSTGVVEYTDPNGSLPRRFYRIVKQL